MFQQLPHGGGSVIAGYGDGRTLPTSIPTDFTQEPVSRWRAIPCDHQANGLPYLTTTDEAVALASGEPVYSLVTGEPYTDDVRVKLEQLAVRTFNDPRQPQQSAYAHLDMLVGDQPSPDVPCADDQPLTADDAPPDAIPAMPTSHSTSLLPMYRTVASGLHHAHHALLWALS